VKWEEKTRTRSNWMDFLMRISPLTILNMDLETKLLSGCLDACIDILLHDAIDGALPAISSVAGHGVV
jgi:hypothetical protein